MLACAIRIRADQTLSRRNARSWRAAAGGTVAVAFLAFAGMISSPAAAVQWNGSGYQFNYRMTGGDTIYYWYHSSAYSGYAGAFDSSIISWYQPRQQGNYPSSGAALCGSPANGLGYQYTPNISNATVEFYALPGSGIYAQYNGWAVFYKTSRPNPIQVLDPDTEAYSWGQVVLNSTIMNSRPEYAGVGSKRTVAAHELGHVLGLAHNQVSGTVMAQQTYRTVIGPTCNPDNNSLKVRW